MTATVFVDTNVLIYAFDLGDAGRQKAAAAWLSMLWQMRGGRISSQVIQEFYARILQKDPSARGSAREYARNLFAWQPIATESSIVEKAWEVQDRFRLSFWDALIVSAAKTLNCSHLLTEDLQAGQKLDGLRVINPFEADPTSLA